MNAKVCATGKRIQLEVTSFNALHLDADHRPCDSKVNYLISPGSGELKTVDELPDRSYRHQIEMPKRSLRMPLREFEELVETRVIELGLLDMDSRAFKNCCSESVEELMKRRQPWGEEKLLQYRGIWELDIHRMTEQLDSDRTVIWTGPGLHQYLKFLERCIRRRCMMLAWLRIYDKSGPGVALRHAQLARLT